MTVRATDILKAVQNLNPAEKHHLREYLIDALTASSSTGNILLEISERKIKAVTFVLTANQSMQFGSGNIRPLLRVRK